MPSGFPIGASDYQTVRSLRAPERRWKRGLFALVGFCLCSIGCRLEGVWRFGPTFTVLAASDSSAERNQHGAHSQYVPDSAIAPADEANRRALEQRAGTQGGKMLLRSVPSGARVFVDGAFVGHTPLLLIVAPGKYKIEMRGEREAFGERTIEMASKETQEVAITLVPRYPQHVTTH